LQRACNRSFQADAREPPGTILRVSSGGAADTVQTAIVTVFSARDYGSSGGAADTVQTAQATGLVLLWGGRRGGRTGIEITDEAEREARGLQAAFLHHAKIELLSLVENQTGRIGDG